ncbi:MAG: polymer-forming cytoskeletal protein [Verrucomicrobiales bacterium]|jgi:cytoskeletal protein CcmA (bactofilin family)|nr:polymer-forming cytoskeletal protein [Verrucomicrobiales bacterium]
MRPPARHGPQKILITCPACRHQQYDYPHANVTYCQQCGERIPINPVASPRKTRKAHTVERRSITCLHCHRELRAHYDAQSWQCPFCSTYLDLRNHQLNQESAAAIRTYGDLEIGAKCLFSGAWAEAENIKIAGRSQCKLQSRHGLTVSGHAKLYAGAAGDHLHVSAAATLYTAGPLSFKTAEIHGKVEARQLTVSERLQVHAGGHVTAGQLTVGEIIVQPGGKLLARYHTEEAGHAEVIG